MGSVGSIIKNCTCGSINDEIKLEKELCDIRKEFDDDLKKMRNTLHSIDNKISANISSFEIRLLTLENAYNQDIKIINNKIDVKFDNINNKLDMIMMNIKK
jgi:hypothetical protein